MSVEGIRKSYGDQVVLAGVDLTLAAADSVLLLGPSGSGKSTLLAILGGLLAPDAGVLRVDGRAMPYTDRTALCELRRTDLGFVFQQAQLLPFLSLRGNLEIVAENAGLSSRETQERVQELLERLELAAHQRKLPGQLSGGQRQRVAIARALVHRPRVVLADEPTAALDWRHGTRVADLLVEQSRQAGTALVVVTHDLRLVPMFQRVYTLNGGCLEESR